MINAAAMKEKIFTTPEFITDLSLSPDELALFHETNRINLMAIETE